METLTDFEVMSGYGEEPTPAAPAPAPAVPAAPAPAPAEPAPAQEFNPDREIDAMSQKYFKDLNANPNLPLSAKLASARGFLATETAIKDQRAKLQAEKQNSLYKDLQMQNAEMSLREQRMKMEQAQNTARYQGALSEQIKGTMFNPELTPQQKRDQIDAIKISNNAAVASNPDIGKLFDTADSILPKRPEPRTFAQEMDIGKVMSYVKTPEELELVQSGDPKTIGFFMEMKQREEKKNSENEELRREAEKEDRAVALSLAKSDFRFMTPKEEKDLNVDDNDPNKGKYLTPESNANGRLLVQMARGAEGIKAYDALSDADRFKLIQEARAEVAIRKLEEAEKPQSNADVKAKNLVQ